MAAFLIFGAALAFMVLIYKLPEPGRLSPAQQAELLTTEMLREMILGQMREH